MRAILVAILLAGCVAAPLATEATASFHVVPVGTTGREPTVGVLRDGTILVGGADATGMGKTARDAQMTARSRDAGASWDLVGDLTQDARANGDPFLAVDPRTGRVFNAALYVACSSLAFSDDAGDTWAHDPVAGCLLPAHDAEKIGVGPAPANARTSGYDGVVYYSYASLRPGTSLDVSADGEGTAVSTSLDGGRTFGAAVLAVPRACVASTSGAVAVAPDGRAYLARAGCDELDIARSDDAGATWSTVGHVGPRALATDIANTEVHMAVDDAGAPYVAWTGPDEVAALAASHDGGASWSAPLRLAPPDVTATVFNDITAGADGRVAVAYLGTTAPLWSSHDPSDAPPAATWNLYVSIVDNASSAAPHVRTTRITSDADPVQRGCVWLRGFGASQPCRNLDDFLGISSMPEGRVVVAYIDGCKACASADDSNAQDLTVALEDAGPRLR